MATTNGNTPKANYFDTILLALGLLLFLAPFVEFKVGGDELFTINAGVNITGVDLLTGKMDHNTVKSMDQDFPMEGSTSKSADVNYFMLAAAILGVIALLISFTRARKNAVFSGILAGLAFVALVGLFIDLQGQFSKATGGDVKFLDFGLTLGFTPWFYISALCFLLAAIISFRQRKMVNAVHETPPKHAPQVPIENPGDQSEFPKSASESEIG